ncbi:uncharacterized protein LOC132608053 [Lycium barbarum]|uniref:uncharacterized protein LOC132608053 n=1 Tax=Lycium barbarum TaxID=112863 RepID=UPI00293E183F|nr:uncharacterized protein LOC132608053 [Lycium barbarum]
MASSGHSVHVNNNEIVAENENNSGLRNLPADPADLNAVNSREGLNRQNTVNQENATFPATDLLNTHNSITLSRAQGRKTPDMPDEINLHLIFEMLQEQGTAIAEQGIAIAQLQSQDDKVKRILIDLGSSANIIRWRVVEQLKLLDQIIPVARILSGFNMASETTKVEISLPINIDGTIQQTVFYVIEGDMKYNALLGRPWIQSMRAAPSTLHQLLKFPTPEGIKTIRGEQPAGNVRG